MAVFVPFAVAIALGRDDGGRGGGGGDGLGVRVGFEVGAIEAAEGSWKGSWKGVRVRSGGNEFLLFGFSLQKKS